MEMRYQTLKENHEALKSFVKEGILSYNWIRDLQIYELFLDLMEKDHKKCVSCVCAQIAALHHISSDRVTQIIKYLSK